MDSLAMDTLGRESSELKVLAMHAYVKIWLRHDDAIDLEVYSK